MSNDELHDLLKASKVPERSDQHWEIFPNEIMRAIERRGSSALKELHPVGPSFGRVWAIGLACACVVIAFVFGFWRGQESKSKASDFAAIQKYFREIELLFPNQLQAVVIDANGPRFVLSESANMPRSTPVVIRVCEGKRCKTVLTFSGQKIQVNNETCEVLLDSKGDVIVVGDDIVWSSAEGNSRRSMHVEARALEQL